MRELHCIQARQSDESMVCRGHSVQKRAFSIAPKEIQRHLFCFLVDSFFFL